MIWGGQRFLNRTQEALSIVGKSMEFYFFFLNRGENPRGPWVGLGASYLAGYWALVTSLWSLSVMAPSLSLGGGGSAPRGVGHPS